MKVGSVGNFEIRFLWPRYLNLETGWRGRLAPLIHMAQRMRGGHHERVRYFVRGSCRNVILIQGGLKFSNPLTYFVVT